MEDGGQKPIEFYFFPSPNGHKVALMLEEVGLPYEVRSINIGEGEQFDPEYLKLNPNNKVPTIVDPDGPGGSRFPVFESGAILLYLGEKVNRFLGGPAGSAERHVVTQWLMFQMASVGPMVRPNCCRVHLSMALLPSSLLTHRTALAVRAKRILPRVRAGH